MKRPHPMTMIDMTAKAEDVSGLLKLLANPNRLMIVCRLLDGEISVGDIETELGIKQPTLSRELGRLRDDGVISARRESKVVFYQLSHPHMEKLIKAICGATLDKNYVAPEPAQQSARAAGFLPRPKFIGSARHNRGGYSQFASVTPTRSES